jgi:prepilin peptidase CpaA
MGAGDVKLLGALGAWLGPAEVFRVALFSGVIGGAIALAIALDRGYAREAIANISVLFTSWRIEGLRPIPQFTLCNRTRPRLAYALPIVAGAVVVIWLR